MPISRALDVLRSAELLQVGDMWGTFFSVSQPRGDPSWDRKGMSESSKPTGHVYVAERQSGRVWFAKWRDGDGQHQRRLGPAWVKPYGQTARGAPRWRTADGQSSSAVAVAISWYVSTPTCWPRVIRALTTSSSFSSAIDIYPRRRPLRGSGVIALCGAAGGVGSDAARVLPPRASAQAASCAVLCH